MQEQQWQRTLHLQCSTSSKNLPDLCPGMYTPVPPAVCDHWELVLSFQL